MREGTAMPNKHQAIILRIFAGLRVGIGQSVPVTTLLLNWAPSLGHAEFADAVESLAAAGWLEAHANATQYALTQTGAAWRPS
jgi:hypothetical protein